MKTLSGALGKLGFQEMNAADSVFTKGCGRELVVLLFYVDYMVIMSESTIAVKKTKQELIADFNITDLVPLKFFLRINFERSSRSMVVCEGKSAERVLERFSMHKSRPVDTPMAANFLSLSGTGPKDDNERKEVAKHPYRAA